jgi:hypothetical protein
MSFRVPEIVTDADAHKLLLHILWFVSSLDAYCPRSASPCVLMPVIGFCGPEMVLCYAVVLYGGVYSCHYLQEVVVKAG